MLESKFKQDFLKELKENLLDVGIEVDFAFSNNRSRPDTYVLGPEMVWAGLEFKREMDSPKQPNQEYHVKRINVTGYARFVYPENGVEVLSELEELFTS